MSFGEHSSVHSSALGFQVSKQHSAYLVVSLLPLS